MMIDGFDDICDAGLVNGLQVFHMSLVGAVCQLTHLEKDN